MQDAGDKGDGLSIEDDVTNTTVAGTGCIGATLQVYAFVMANSCTMCMHTLT